MADPRSITIEFTSPAGEPLRFDWPLERLGTVGAAAERPWALSGELDWDEIEAVRILSARLGDGRTLALVAVRPLGAAGHGDDAIAAVLVADGEPERLAEALLSTESGPDGRVRRVGLELYRGEQAMPVRVAADATGASERVEGGVRHRRVALEVHGEEPGAGLFETLTAA